MTWAKAVFGEPSFFDTTYTLRDGIWTGRCDALGVTVEAPTLELARNKMRASAKAARKSTHTEAVGVERVESSYTEQLLVRRFLNQVTVGEVAGREPARGPYVTDEGQLLLRDSVVTVMDELGTTERWLDNLTEKDVADRKKLLKATRTALNNPVSANVESVVSYTDNIIHAMPLGSSDPAEAMLYALPAPARYQLDLACAGVLLRGGTDVGSHHASPDLLIGQALICAHHIESKVAKFPRIVLSDTACDVALAAFAGGHGDSDVEYLRGMVARSDEDGLLFVNYLALPKVLESPDEDVTATVKRHRDTVVANLHANRNEPKFLAKWAWVADYHNFVVTALGLHSSTLVPSDAAAGLGVHGFGTP